MNTRHASTTYNNATNLQKTEGTLLGGSVLYNQFTQGYRTGIEPVFLAAFVPARPGDIVVEAGCGAGAGLLCLAHRTPGISGFGLECDPNLVRLAQENFSNNGFENLVPIRARIPDIPAFLPGGHEFYDHVFANPPWHRPLSTPSADSMKETAKRLSATLLEEWLGALTARLRPKGSLSLAIPAALLSTVIPLMAKRELGDITIFPLWPKEGRKARIILIRGRKAIASESTLLPGLVLHEASGQFSTAAQRILREGEALCPPQ